MTIVKIVKGFKKMGSIRIKKCGSYEARVQKKGFKPKSASFPTKKEAQSWIKQTESEMLVNNQTSKCGKSKVSDAIDEYIKERPASDTEKVWLFVPAKKILGSMKIDHLTSTVMQSFVDKLRTTPRKEFFEEGRVSNSRDDDLYSGSTIRHFFHKIKQVIDWHSIKHRYALRKDLFDVKIPDCWEKPRDRRLFAGELELLKLTADEINTRPFCGSAIIEFATQTGMRCQEIAYIKWSDVNLDGDAILLKAEYCKTKQPREVALTPRAKEIVDCLRLANEECKESCEITLNSKVSEDSPFQYIFWEFKGNPESISSFFKSVTKKANIKGLTFHDLRHEAVSMLCEGRKISGGWGN